MEELSLTKKKLLQAASVEFANMGYQKARIRKISQASGTNLAAVNYHFGGKSNLYLAAMDYVFQETDDGYKVDAEKLSDPEACRNMLHDATLHFLDTLGHNNIYILRNRILYREINEPSALYHEVFERFIRPRMTFLELLLSRAYGRPLAEEELKLKLFLAVSIFSFYSNAHSLVEALAGERFIRDNREQIAEQIIKNLLA